jgi:Ca-activated chloride channel family protein
VSFLEPLRLWLLVGVAALAVAYGLLQLRRRTWALRFTNVDLLRSVAPRRPGWRRHVPAAVYLLALAALVVGFARPTRDERVPRERATVVMAIDVSLSMEATDVPPSRLEAAQAAAKRFLDLVPPKINVGLVTFNGVASVRVPPTTDREAVRRVIDTLELGERTAIGEAIFASLDAIAAVPPDEEGTPPPARVVLMSDGTTTDGRPNEEGVAAAREAGVPVSTIAFGTDYGTIRVPEEPTPIPVPVDRPALQAIAEGTGGEFYAAATEGELTRVYEDIGSSVGYVTEEREIGTWFIGIALVLLLAGGGLSLVWFSRLP